MKLNVPFKITYLKLIKLLDISSTCTINKTNYYFGCLRSRTERQRWHHMTTEQQREVLRLIAGRKLRIELMRLRKNEQLGFDFEEDVEMGELF
jgi:uncharacterized protein